MTDEGTTAQVPAAELARLRRIEAAARHVLSQWPPTRSATPLLAAMAELRAALGDAPSA